MKYNLPALQYLSFDQPVSLKFTISDLRQRPEFLDTVADRIWQAWWMDSGHPLDFISSRLRDENLNADPIPFALIAHDGASFLGTASVIVSDLAERPHLTPWVAAVWVEPHARQHGVGAALVHRATRDCFALGVNRAYLCARPARSAFYERLGWSPIERDVGPHRLSVFVRGTDAISRSRP
ncbi:MAG TPA: GNAT family N-acetyltransferase [Bradyrhizobium sp.]|nr:GNAT family N-acetyltransferase [Bradyrhizobium sp.]